MEYYRCSLLMHSSVYSRKWKKHAVLISTSSSSPSSPTIFSYGAVLIPFSTPQRTINQKQNIAPSGTFATVLRSTFRRRRRFSGHLRCVLNFHVSLQIIREPIMLVLIALIELGFEFYFRFLNSVNLFFFSPIFCFFITLKCSCWWWMEQRK